MRATQSLLRTIVGLIILRSQASLKKVHPEPKRRDLGLYYMVFVYIFCIYLLQFALLNLSNKNTLIYHKVGSTSHPWAQHRLALPTRPVEKRGGS